VYPTTATDLTVFTRSVSTVNVEQPCRVKTEKRQRSERFMRL